MTKCDICHSNGRTSRQSEDQSEQNHRNENGICPQAIAWTQSTHPALEVETAPDVPVCSKRHQCHQLDQLVVVFAEFAVT